VGRSVGPHYPFTRRPDRRTELDAVVVREGKNLKGRVLGLVLGSIGKLPMNVASEIRKELQIIRQSFNGQPAPVVGGQKPGGDDESGQRCRISFSMIVSAERVRALQC
jgi:hypothetical protein